MTSRVGSRATSKNLLVFHLESVAWQTLHAFPDAFPNLSAFMTEARTYRSYISSATSTQMVMAAFLHGNDCEMDAGNGISKPAGNQPSLFKILAAAGYSTSFLCASAYPQRPIVKVLADSMPEAWATSDFSALLQRFDAATEEAPFAVYLWSMVPHVQANLALAPFAEGLSDLVAGSCAVVDKLLGATLDGLRTRGLLEDMTVMVFGDHGDDYWTHGFKEGMLHGLEPYAPLVHAPLIIRDRDLPPGIERRIVSTVDLQATCLDLLQLPHEPAFASCGSSILGQERRIAAFAQNFTASQRDAKWADVRKAFSAFDESHVLMVSSLGLEFFDRRLDPGNHSNLLHFFELGSDGQLMFVEPQSRHLHPHFGTVSHMWRSGGPLQGPFGRLRNALKTLVVAKNAYVMENGGDTRWLLDITAFDRINRAGRERFFNRQPSGPSHAEAGVRQIQTQVGSFLETIFGRRRTVRR